MSFFIINLSPERYFLKAVEQIRFDLLEGTFGINAVTSDITDIFSALKTSKTSQNHVSNCDMWYCSNVPTVFI